MTIQTGPLTLWSIGHSTHSLEGFLALLARNDVAVVADIRTVPRSRRFPHFGSDQLAAALPEHGLRYRHLVALGGRRAPRQGSPNTAWHNRSFRGYADHARTAEFAQGLAALREIARTAPTAMMCSEALWWRCHRRLVADRIVAAGDVVLHIASDGRSSPHQITPFASLDADGTITYPAQS